MAFGSDRKQAAVKRVLAVVLGLALLAAFGCTSKKESEPEENSEGGKQPAATQANATPDIDLNCVIEHIQNPPEAFHYSYKRDSSTPWAEEADITPQTIDGSFTNASGTHPIHGVKSDEDSWHTAWSGLMGIASMSSTMALVHASSAEVVEGKESMNGFDTVKFSIDTARGNAVEQGLYRTVLGPGGFEKGTVWATAQGCPVKMSIDSETHMNDGSVDKVRYEEAMIKK
jgi:hypothetical protein